MIPAVMDWRGRCDYCHGLSLWLASPDEVADWADDHFFRVHPGRPTTMRQRIRYHDDTGPWSRT